jgi:phosphatidylglycerophosphate synthase
MSIVVEPGPEPGAGRRLESDVERERRRALSAAERYSPRPLTAGERWTVEALFELRRDRYRLDAWARFLAGSLERSRTTRRVRPALARQGRRWGLYGALGWIAAWRFSRGGRRTGLRVAPGLAWWALVWQMLDWHLGMAEGGDGVPRERLAPADAVTLGRFWLVPALPTLAGSPTGLPAVVAIAGATDWLDGVLARGRGRTRLGRDLDTTADLAFLAAAAVSARKAGRLTRLGFRALACRQAVGAALAVGAVFGRARRPALRARPWGSLPRFSGLALCAGGLSRTGTIVLVCGCLVPPRSTAPTLSPA